MPTDFVSGENGKVSVFMDHREPFQMSNYLSDLGASVQLKQLQVADYICSERVAVEKKTISDFLQSIINLRIFKQAKEISESFERPVIILEGNPDMLFLERGVHANSIRGVLSSLAIDYKIPLMWTANTKETANMVFWMARREQIGEKKEIQIRAKVKKESLPEQQEFILAGLPNISNKLSRSLLSHFKTVKKVFNASEEKLQKVDGIGEEKAKRIWNTINSAYNPDEKQE